MSRHNRPSPAVMVDPYNRGFADARAAAVVALSRMLAAEGSALARAALEAAVRRVNAIEPPGNEPGTLAK